MKTIPSFFFLLLLSVASSATDRQGLTPRRNPADYPSHMEKQELALGAALLTSDQVKASFVSDLNRAYLVVEVSVYPAKDHPLDLARRDFVLKSTDNEVLGRPADPQAVALSLQKAAGSDREISLYPSVGVGYESGPVGYDPVTGERRGGGLRTSAGMGVGIGRSSAGTTEPDRRTMEIELSEKGLPEGNTERAVSGYLYFPWKDRKKVGSLRLELISNGEPVNVRLLEEGPKK
jgi:hypothetical protein